MLCNVNHFWCIQCDDLTMLAPWYSVYLFPDVALPDCLYPGYFCADFIFIKPGLSSQDDSVRVFVMLSTS